MLVGLEELMSFKIGVAVLVQYIVILYRDISRVYILWAARISKVILKNVGKQLI